MISRRRMIKISAAMAIGGGTYGLSDRRFHWQGIAFGADVSLTIIGDKARSKATLIAVQAEIERLENIFSLYRPKSEISQLNAQIDKLRSSSLSRDMAYVLDLAEAVKTQSFGQFEPMLGGIWQAKANGAPAPTSLTLNGIAQGFASDRIAMLLQDFGFTKTLVNMGEFVAGEGKWRLNASGITRKISQSAAATSRANALTFQDGSSHIISPSGRNPLWSEVTVFADNGALADAWSTAMIVMRENEIREVHSQGLIRSAILTPFSGQPLSI